MINFRSSRVCLFLLFLLPWLLLLWCLLWLLIDSLRLRSFFRRCLCCSGYFRLLLRLRILCFLALNRFLRWWSNNSFSSGRLIYDRLILLLGSILLSFFFIRQFCGLLALAPQLVFLFLLLLFDLKSFLVFGGLLGLSLHLLLAALFFLVLDPLLLSVEFGLLHALLESLALILLLLLFLQHLLLLLLAGLLYGELSS